MLAVTVLHHHRRARSDGAVDAGRRVGACRGLSAVVVLGPVNRSGTDRVRHGARLLRARCRPGEPPRHVPGLERPAPICRRRTFTPLAPVEEHGHLVAARSRHIQVGSSDTPGEGRPITLSSSF